jgi:hypothetical protein
MKELYALLPFATRVTACALPNIAILPVNANHISALESSLRLANFIATLEVLALNKPPPYRGRAILDCTELLNISGTFKRSMFASNPKVWL